MHFEKEYTYHLYNRSNEVLFKNEENYLFFLQKLRTHIVPFADILAYCLMPNHFHLMIKVNIEGVKLIGESHRATTQALSKNIGIMLSSYRNGTLINKKLAIEMLNLDISNYSRISMKDLNEEEVKYIF